MKTIAEWSVTEYLDCDWPAQLVWRQLERPVGNGSFIVDDGNGKRVPAQVGDQGKRVYFIAELAAGETVNYRLCDGEGESASASQLIVKDGVAEILNVTV